MAERHGEALDKAHRSVDSALRELGRMATRLPVDASGDDCRDLVAALASVMRIDDDLDAIGAAVADDLAELERRRRTEEATR
jgi:hypothetical protein